MMRSLWLSLLASKLAATAFAAGKTCYDFSDVVLEAVFLQPLHDIPWHSYFHLKTITMIPRLNMLGTSLESSFNHPNFTIATFRDYGPESLGMHEGCFKFYLPMSDKGAWSKSVRHVDDDVTKTDPLQNDTKDSSLTAIALTATLSKTLGFTTAATSSDGKRVVRVIILATDAEPYTAGTIFKERIMPPFKGDGNDTCNNDAPELSQVVKFLNDKDMFLIVMAQEGHSFDWWSTQGKQTFGSRIVVKSLGTPLKYGDPSGTIYKVDSSEVLDGLQEVLCNQVSTTTPPQTTPSRITTPTQTTSSRITAPTQTVPPSTCYPRDTTQVQVLLLQTIHDMNWDLQFSPSTASFVGQMRQLGDRLTGGYRDCQFTLGSFHDYGDGIINSSTCAHFYVPMSRSGAWEDSLNDLTHDAMRAPALNDPRKDSSLTAVAMALTRNDKTGFLPGPFAPSRKPLLRVVILVTDAIPLLAGEVPSQTPRLPFMGDGLDTCERDAPTLEKVVEFLNKVDSYLIVMAQQGPCYDWWSQQGQQAFGDRLIVQHVGKSVYNLDVEKVISAINSKFCSKIPLSQYQSSQKSFAMSQYEQSNALKSAFAQKTPQQRNEETAKALAAITRYFGKAHLAQQQNQDTAGIEKAVGKGESCAFTPNRVHAQAVVLQAVHDLQNGNTFEAMIDLMAERLLKLKDSFATTFGKSEMTLAAFKDFGSSKSGPSQSCFHSYLPLQGSSALETSIVMLEEDDIITGALQSPGFDSSLTAVAMAITKKDAIGFSTENNDAEGKRFARVIVLVTDSIPLIASNAPGSRPPFLGDGSDTCDNDSPGLEQVSKIMATNGVSLVVAIQGAKPFAWWNNDAKAFFGPRMKAVQLNGDASTGGTVFAIDVEKVVDAVKELVCLVQSPPKTAQTTELNAEFKNLSFMGKSFQASRSP